MKIAYLILVHNNARHLERLIQSLLFENTEIFVHVDKKRDINQFANFKDNEKVHYIKERVSVNWGGYSMVKAQLNLLRSTRTEFDYYILLSGVDYPVKSNEYIKEYLTLNNGKNFIGAEAMPLSHKPMDRLSTFHLEGGIRAKGIKKYFIKLGNQILKYTINKRALPCDLIPYAGSQWWALHKDFVKHLLIYLEENEEIEKFYKNTFIPDEMFFQTLIMNSAFKESVRGTLTYTDWEMGPAPYPSIIQKMHLPYIYGDQESKGYRREYFFARKFDEESSDLLDEIDKYRN